MWWNDVLEECRVGRLSEHNFCYLHGFPTTAIRNAPTNLHCLPAARARSGMWRVQAAQAKSFIFQLAVAPQIRSKLTCIACQTQTCECSVGKLRQPKASFSQSQWQKNCKEALFASLAIRKSRIRNVACASCESQRLHFPTRSGTTNQIKN